MLPGALPHLSLTPTYPAARLSDPLSPALTALDVCPSHTSDSPTEFWLDVRWAVGCWAAEPALPRMAGAWLCLTHGCPSVKVNCGDPGVLKLGQQQMDRLSGVRWFPFLSVLWSSPGLPALETTKKQDVFPPDF